MLYKFSEKCKLEFFIHLCILNNVGHGKVEPYLNVVELCHQISEVKRVRMVEGKLQTATPDELFDQFSEILVSLPENANIWTLQLCSSYLLALTSDLLEAITSEKTFVVSDLSKLSTKALQLDDLRTIRTHISARYCELLKEKEKRMILLHNLNTRQNRGLELSTQEN